MTDFNNELKVWREARDITIASQRPGLVGNLLEETTELARGKDMNDVVDAMLDYFVYAANAIEGIDLNQELLEKELEELKLVRRPEVVERIKIARSYGDLSENSEYEAAKDEQAFVEGQISSLETKIRYAEIVDSDAVAKDEVGIGKTVTIQEVGEAEKEVYIIVGSAGADAFAGKVSNESPIGQALIGKKKGDIATVETPVGSYDVKILKVEKTK